MLDDDDDDGFLFVQRFNKNRKVGPVMYINYVGTRKENSHYNARFRRRNYYFLIQNLRRGSDEAFLDFPSQKRVTAYCSNWKNSARTHDPLLETLGIFSGVLANTEINSILVRLCRKTNIIKSICKKVSAPYHFDFIVKKTINQSTTYVYYVVMKNLRIPVSI